MALTTVTVRKRVISNNVVEKKSGTSETDCIETAKIIIATPSVCYAGNGDVDTAVNSKIVVEGVANTDHSLVTLYVTQTVAEIAALT